MHSQVRAVEPLAAVRGGGADERAGEGFVRELGYLKLRILLLQLIMVQHLSILTAADCVPYRLSLFVRWAGGANWSRVCRPRCGP
jgi:hypothetical protein